jgi:hypothetical protein
LTSEDKKFPLPIYSADEDIYAKDKEVSLEEEDEEAKLNAKLSEGLDVPGSELDDAGEEIGEEDEENNFTVSEGMTITIWKGIRKRIAETFNPGSAYLQ